MCDRSIVEGVPKHPLKYTEGPPPRYLNVSLAAFGYTCYNRKWVSAQTLELGKTPVRDAPEPNPTSEGATTTTTTSALPTATLTPQRHKSTSPASLSGNGPVQRPLHLDFHDVCNGPDMTYFVRRVANSLVVGVFTISKYEMLLHSYATVCGHSLDCLIPSSLKMTECSPVFCRFNYANH
ncbi:unnamed protein product [Rodentolepis nana]|uniref:Uncharacterized protein n=1 Tax=Rodentolepis nana TaxID=102285 RepID=A0A0R3TV77_RODNA|nr:unnamed protein product [Rodentolepis nana]